MSWRKSWRHPATQQGGGIPPGASQALPDTLLCCLLRQELLFPQQGNFLGSRQQQGGSRSWEPSRLQPPHAGVAPLRGDTKLGVGAGEMGAKQLSTPSTHQAHRHAPAGVALPTILMPWGVPPKLGLETWK